MEDADDDGDGVEDEDEDNDGDGISNEGKIYSFSTACGNLARTFYVWTFSKYISFFLWYHSGGQPYSFIKS